RGDPNDRRSGSATRALPVYLAAVLGGVVLAVAWLLPGTAVSAVLGWVGVLLLVAAVRARRALLPAYCAGLIGHLVRFYWGYPPVCLLGGFGPPAGALIFATFIAVGALQFLVFALIHHQLGPGFDALALRSATAVVLAELLTLRLFPWHFGHTQI